MENRLISFIKKWIKKIWNDPVWSKVIAVGILALIVALYNLINSYKSHQNFVDSLYSILTQKVALWIFLLFLMFLYIANWIYKKFIFNKSSNHSDGKNESGLNTFIDTKEIFNSNNSPWSHYSTFKKKLYINNQPVGNPGEGNLDIKNNEIVIEKTNTEGRIGAKITKYSYQGKIQSFIEKNLSIQDSRSFLVSFEAKVTDGSFIFKIYLKRHRSDDWIDKANEKWTIRNTQWKEQHGVINVPPSIDFDIWFDALDNEKPNSFLQIKNLIITEE